MLKPCLIFCWQRCGGYMWINGKQLPTAAFPLQPCPTHSLKYEHCNALALLPRALCEPEAGWGEWLGKDTDGQCTERVLRKRKVKWMGGGTVFAETNIAKALRGSSDLRNSAPNSRLFKRSLRSCKNIHLDCQQVLTKASRHKHDLWLYEILGYRLVLKEPVPILPSAQMCRGYYRRAAIAPTDDVIVQQTVTSGLTQVRHIHSTQSGYGASCNAKDGVTNITLTDGSSEGPRSSKWAHKWWESAWEKHGSNKVWS